MAFASGNPALKVLDRVERNQGGGGGGGGGGGWGGPPSQPSAAAAGAMTVQGTVNKLLILFGIALITATFAWSQYKANPGMLYGLAITGMIGGLIAALVTSFKPHVAHISAPIYAAFEGLFLGAISVVVAKAFPQVPIIMQATGLTFGTLAAMLIAYKTGLIKPTEKFKAFIVAAIGAIFIVYMINLLLMLFGMRIPFLHQGGPIGIGISLAIIAIAALSLILDFDFIDRGEREGLPRQYEWYGAFGLMVTLVWLYIEILRLLIILNSQRD